VTVPAQRRRQDASGLQKAPVVRMGECANVAGHGLLSHFHNGCRCPWCASQARERDCCCGACAAVRAHCFVVLAPGWRH